MKVNIYDNNEYEEVTLADVIKKKRTTVEELLGLIIKADLVSCEDLNDFFHYDYKFEEEE